MAPPYSSSICVPIDLPVMQPVAISAIVYTTVAVSIIDAVTGAAAVTMGMVAIAARAVVDRLIILDGFIEPLRIISVPSTEILAIVKYLLAVLEINFLVEFRLTACE